MEVFFIVRIWPRDGLFLMTWDTGDGLFQKPLFTPKVFLYLGMNKGEDVMPEKLSHQRERERLAF